MTTNENPAAVRVCAIADIQCSRGCGTGECKREREARYPDLQPAAAPIDDAAKPYAYEIGASDRTQMLVYPSYLERYASEEERDMPRLALYTAHITAQAPIEYTTAMGEAATRYLDSKGGGRLPGQFFWCECFAAMLAASYASPPAPSPADERAAPCVHADDPKACYRVRCQLGGKCVDDDMSPRQPAQADARVGLTDERILEEFVRKGFNVYDLDGVAIRPLGRAAIEVVRALLQGANHAG